MKPEILGGASAAPPPVLRWPVYIGIYTNQIMTSQSPAGLSTSFCNLFSLQEYNHLIKFILFMYFCHRYGNHKDNGNKNVSYPMILKGN